VYSEVHCRLALLHAREEWSAGQSARFVFFRRGEEDGPVVGNASFTEIVRGPLLGCFLGYKLDEKAQGQGLMFEGLTAAIAWAFDELGLHRISANYRPTNERSGRVLRRLGFVVEGYARDYLFIDGAWRDHILTSLTNPKARP
jgi:ribosomal-protein-alanine N-acetyltransferase